MTRDFMMTMGAEGLLIAIVTIIAFYKGLGTSAALASTMAFATLTMSRLLHGFNCRRNESIIEIGLTSNIYSIYAFIAGSCLLMLALFVPALHGLFSVADITAAQIFGCIGLALIPTVIIQAAKLICRRRI